MARQRRRRMQGGWRGLRASRAAKLQRPRWPSRGRVKHGGERCAGLGVSEGAKRDSTNESGGDAGSLCTLARLLSSGSPLPSALPLLCLARLLCGRGQRAAGQRSGAERADGNSRSRDARREMRTRSDEEDSRAGEEQREKRRDRSSTTANIINIDCLSHHGRVRRVLPSRVGGFKALQKNLLARGRYEV